MPIDPGVLTPNIQPVPSVAGTMVRAAAMQEAQARAQAYRQKAMEDAADQQENEQIKAILRQTGGDFEKALPQIAMVSAPKALKIQQTVNESQLTKAKLDDFKLQHDLHATEYVSRQVQGVTDQNSYDYAKAAIAGAGLPVDQMPPQYDPAYVEGLKQKGLSMKEQIEMAREDRMAKFQQLTAERQQTAEERAQAREERMAQAQQVQLGLEKQRVGLEGARVGLEKQRLAQGQTGGGTGALTDEGVDYAATQYRMTGKMPPMGMGNSQARAAIINKAAEQARIIGQTPVASIQRQAAFSADSKSLGKLQSMADAAGAYENKALAQLDIVDGLSNKVSRTSIPLINRAIMAGKTEIQGDPDATLLLNAIMTASTEYAKIMMGGTGSAQAVTDSAMKESQKLLNASMNQATLRQATALMRKEMGLTMQGYDAALGHINERMGGQSQQATPAATTGGPKVGERRKFGNQIGVWDGKGWKPE